MEGLFYLSVVLMAAMGAVIGQRFHVRMRDSTGATFGAAAVVGVIGSLGLTGARWAQFSNLDTEPLLPVAANAFLLCAAFAFLPAAASGRWVRRTRSDQLHYDECE